MARKWYVHSSRGDYQYEFTDDSSTLEHIDELLLDALAHGEDCVITVQFIAEPDNAP